MDLSWLTGKVSRDHYLHSRPEYLRLLERDQSPKPTALQTEAVDESAIRDEGLPREPGNS
jgi:hypothetical protein